MEEERIKKDESKNSLLESISYDSWSVITSFIEDSNVVIALLETSKFFQELFEYKSLNFFENVVFRVILSDINFVDIVKKMRFYVQSLDLLVDPVREKWLNFDDMSVPFVQEVKDNSETFRKFMDHFPRLKSLSIDLSNRMFVWNEVSYYPSGEFYIPSSVFLEKKLRDIHLKNNCLDDPIKLYGTLSLLGSVEKITIECFRNKTVEDEGNLVCYEDLPKIKTLKSLKLEKILNLDFLTGNESLETLILIDYFPVGKVFINEEAKRKHFDFPKLEHFTYEVGEIDVHEQEVGCEELRDVRDILLFSKSIRSLSFNVDDSYLLFLDDSRTLESELCTDFERISQKFLDASIRLHTLSFQSGIFSFSSYHFLTNITYSVSKLDLSRNFEIKKPTLLLYLNTNNHILKEIIIDYCDNTSFHRKEEKDQFDDELLLALKDVNSLSMVGCNQDSITEKGFMEFNNLRFINISKCNQKGLSENLFKILFSNNPKLRKIQIHKNGYCLRRIPKIEEMSATEIRNTVIRREEIRFLKGDVRRFLTLGTQHPEVYQSDMYVDDEYFDTTVEHGPECKEMKEWGWIVLDRRKRCVQTLVHVCPQFERSVKSRFSRCSKCSHFVKAFECSLKKSQCKELFCPFCDEKNVRMCSGYESCGKLICGDCCTDETIEEEVKEEDEEYVDLVQNKKNLCRECNRIMNRCEHCKKLVRMERDHECFECYFDEDIQENRVRRNYYDCFGCDVRLCEECMFKIGGKECSSCLERVCGKCVDIAPNNNELMYKVCEKCDRILCSKDPECQSNRLECENCGGLVVLCPVCMNDKVYICHHTDEYKIECTKCEGKVIKNCQSCGSNKCNECLSLDWKCVKCGNDNLCSECCVRFCEICSLVTCSKCHPHLDGEKNFECSTCSKIICGGKDCTDQCESCERNFCKVDCRSNSLEGVNCLACEEEMEEMKVKGEILQNENLELLGNDNNIISPDFHPEKLE